MTQQLKFDPRCGCVIVQIRPGRAMRRRLQRLHPGAETYSLHRAGCPIAVRAGARVEKKTIHKAQGDAR